MNAYLIMYVSAGAGITKLRAFLACSPAPSPVSFLTLCESSLLQVLAVRGGVEGNTHPNLPAPNLAVDLITQETPHLFLSRALFCDRTHRTDKCLSVSVSLSRLHCDLLCGKGTSCLWARDAPNSEEETNDIY